VKYAIGDIHGGSRTFRTLLKRINLRHVDTLYLLGDYIDRGRDSKGVLDIIWQLMTAGYDVQPIRGNHEDMLLRDLAEDHDLSSIYWMKGWGKDTLKSFGVSAVRKLSSHYLTLLDAFPYLLMDDRESGTNWGLEQ
jgi:serine/threonine protein phosphatase 1